MLIGIYSRNIPKSLWQTALNLIILAVMLIVLRAFAYFMGVVTVRYGFAIGWFAG